MKSPLAVINLAVFLGLSTAASAEREEYQIDRSHSYVGFEIAHFGYSRTVGRFNDLDGKLVIDSETPTATEVEVEINTASIDTNHEKRDEHLRSADFFDVKQHPTMAFKSRKVEMSGDKSGKLIGDLTILGVTKPVTFDFEMMAAAPFPLPGYHNVYTRGFHANGKIRRSDFGMNIYLDGGAIGDEVAIDLNFDAVRCVGEAAKAPSCTY